MAAKESSPRAQRATRPARRDKAATRDALQKAILRVQKSDERMSISAVAREAGVTPALIHNVYADVAEEIRRLAGKGVRAQRDAIQRQLAEERARSRDLREKLKAAESDLAKQASINAMLRHEIDLLKAFADDKVRQLPRKKP